MPMRAERTAKPLSTRSAEVHRIDDFRIDLDIPIPPKRNGPISKYRGTLKRLPVGGSFYVPDGSRQGALDQARLLGIKVEVRKMGSGVRIWRKE